MDLLFREILTAVIFALIGAVATPLATALKRYTDKFRPSVKLALKILPFVDKDIMDGRVTEHPIYDIALSYVTEYAEEGVSAEFLQKAAEQAMSRLSLKVLDEKIKQANG
jgi:hypothetical protein